jgi:putative ABC transport system substrate-binding protein
MKKALRLVPILFVLAADATMSQAQTAKVPRIGLLSHGSPAAFRSLVEVFRKRLRELGYIEGTNIILEHRWAEGNADRLLPLAADLIRLKVDVIVAPVGHAALAAKKVTTTTPIVIVAVDTVVTPGPVGGPSDPLSNAAGRSLFSSDLGSKRLELLKEAVPRISRIALLVQRNNPLTVPLVGEMEISARALKVEVRSFQVTGAEEFESAFAALTHERADGLYVQNDAVLNPNNRAIGKLAAKHRLPAVGAILKFVHTGGLMGYAPDLHELYQRAAIVADKILKGAKPTALPVEQPISFKLVLNLKTAKQIGVVIPAAVLLRAAEVVK